MNLKDENYHIIDKTLFEDFLNDDEKLYYLYHYIVVEYKDKNDIKYLKIDNIKDLKKLKDLNVQYKYYIKRIHYYNNESDNLFFEEGYPSYIYNLGYFFIGGFIKTNEKEKMKKLLKEYKSNYKNLSFELNDKEFLSLNKSVINF